MDLWSITPFTVCSQNKSKLRIFFFGGNIFVVIGMVPILFRTEMSHWCHRFDGTALSNTMQSFVNNHAVGCVFSVMVVPFFSGVNAFGCIQSIQWTALQSDMYLWSTGCAGNSPVTSEFPAQRASNAENVSIWWRHHASIISVHSFQQLSKIWHALQWARRTPKMNVHGISY